MKNDQV